MANHYLFNVFNHLQPIRAWAKVRDARMNLSADTFELTLHLAAHSVTLMPRFMVAEDISHGRLAVPFEQALDSAGYYVLAYPEASADLPALRLFRDWLIATLREG